MGRETICNSVENIVTGAFLLDLKEDTNQELVINENANVLITDCNKGSHLTIQIKNNAKLVLSVLSKNSIENLEIIANLEKNADFEAYFADFSNGKGKARIEVNLNEEGANAKWHLASLAGNNDNKEFDVSIIHKVPNTYGQSDNYGVCKDDARLVFSGVSSIAKYAVKSRTNQNAKIMVFDEKSIGVAKPILKIDENDIQASHAAIVGKINDDHLFYLTSRGLTEEQAKQLITFGYLKPIINGFEEDEVKEEINTLIEGRM